MTIVPVPCLIFTHTLHKQVYPFCKHFYNVEFSDEFFIYMEGLQNVNPWGCLESIQIFITMVYDPIFSCIITLSVLILLYFPHGFSFFFSPVLVLTSSLLLSLLRLGVTQRIETENREKGSTARPRVAEFEEEGETESAPVELKSSTSPTCKNEVDLIMRSLEENFVEWDVRAPLEVIYEEFEGDEEGKDQSETRGIERYSSLSLFYPESDSDSSSEEEDMDFPAIGEWVSWEDDDSEGLIEISLYKREIDFLGEDDNLIEIDIS